jgi:hypothetical protein
MKFFFTVNFCLCFCIALFPQSFNAEIIEKKTDITIQQSNLVTKEYIKILINKRVNETRYTDVEVIHQKNEKISSLEGWIEDANGNIIRKLQKKDIVESSADKGETFYDDYLSIKFSLRYNEYPYYICYSYTKTDPTYLIITEWSPVFDTDIPTRKANLALTVPKGYEFFIDTSGVKFLQTTEQKDVVSYQWSGIYETPLVKEKYAPPLQQFIPIVKITPKMINYFVTGSFETWSDFGRWYSDMIQGLDVLPPEEVSKVRSLVKDAGSNSEKVRILYHYLQDNTRYINVSTKFGGLRPMPAEYVTNNKYGDCKALVNYTKALFESVGIKSFYSIVYAGDNPVESDKGMPFPEFNHVILLVPNGNDSIWLDCTSQTLPFNYLGSFTSGRKAFVIDKDKSTFVKTQNPSYKEAESVRNFDFKLDPLGYGTVDARFILKGDDFENFLGVKTELDLKEQRQLLNKFLNYSRLEINDYILTMDSRDSKEISFKTGGNAEHFLKKIQNDIAVIPAMFYLPDIEAPAKRKFPVKIILPIACRDTVCVEMTNALSLLVIPKNVDISNEFGFYRTNVLSTGNKITIVRELCVFPGEYSKDKYPAFYSFITAVKKNEKNCGIVVTNPSLK